MPELVPLGVVVGIDREVAELIRANQAEAGKPAAGRLIPVPQSARTSSGNPGSARAAPEFGQRARISGVDKRASAVCTAPIKSAALRPRCSAICSGPRGSGVDPLPVLDPDQNNVDPLAILSQQTAWIEQLLEDLVVRCKLDRGGKPQLFHPEGQCILDRLGRERGSDDEPVNRPRHILSLEYINTSHEYILLSNTCAILLAIVVGTSTNLRLAEPVTCFPHEFSLE